MLRLEVKAPFAAFRTFTAGSYRPTARFITPSAAYGLLLNLAGIESRRDDGLSPMTVTEFGLPPARIALGDYAGGSGPYRPPEVHTIFQQLHNYPVGASGSGYKEGAKGSKYNITPVRREFLSDLHVCIAIDENPELERQIERGISPNAKHKPGRYGIPFLGDNSFLIDVIRPDSGGKSAWWYRRIGVASGEGAVPNSARLTIWIDRQDLSKTKSDLYAPAPAASVEIPEEAWTRISPPAGPS